MEVLEAYKEVFTTNKTYIFLKSGRAAGKTTVGAQKIVKALFGEDGDVFVGRANYGDLEQTIMAEIMRVIEELGLSEYVKTRTRPLKIINQLNGNKVIFKGIGGADIHRTKGMVPDKPYWSLIVIDELQQVERQSNLSEAMATFLRDLKEGGQVLYMFNPDKRASHWCNEFYRACEYNNEYLTLYTSYKDIAGVLNEHTLKDILVAKKYDPNDYKHRYLGQTEGLFGAVYASFDDDLHVLSESFAKKMVKKVGIYAFLIGADPASTRDATALVPMLLLRNGQVIVIDYFYHDPMKNSHVTNDKMTPLIRRWLEDIISKWKIDRNLPIHAIFDNNSVSQDLMQTLNYRLPSNFNGMAISHKKIIEMADVMRSAFSRNLIYIVDTEGYHNYYNDTFVYGQNPLIRQLKTVVWNDNGDGFDKNVPNDLTDALTYGIVHYMREKGNMYFPEPKEFYKPLKREGES